jgi:signal transduction histidine kinase
MRERIEELGGVFRLQSESGCGTKIYASIPLSNSPIKLTAKIDKIIQ